MKNRLDLARFPRRANADSTHRARVSNAHCTRCTAKSHADPTRSNTQGRKLRLSWGFVARSRLLCENGCSPQGRETRAIGAAGAQVPYKDKVGGSNPSSPTIGYEKGRRMFRRPFFRCCQQRMHERMFHVKHSQRSAMAAPHTYGAVGTSGLGYRTPCRSHAAPDANRRGARPLARKHDPAPKSQAESGNYAEPGPASDQETGLDETGRRSASPYFPPFGAQSFMPGMAPPATSQRYRLATEPYGA